MSTAEPLTSKTWQVRIDIGEHTGTTHAVARLDTGCGTDLRGVGEARVNPHDLDVPEIGDELATARALSYLADALLDTAAGDLTRVLHAAVNLGR